MNGLNLFKINEELKMSSREIAQLTCKQHKHVLVDCDKLNYNYLKMNLAEISAGVFLHPNTGNQQHREYNLTKMQCFDLLTGYNTELRIKVNRRWAELEAKELKIPQTFAEALQLAADQAKKIELQNKKLELQAPKVEFYDSVTNSKSTIDIGNAAKVLNVGFGRNKLFEKLRDMKILMGNNQPYQKYIDVGYFRVIETKYNKPDGSTHINLKTLVYQKGLDFIMKKLNKK